MKFEVGIGDQGETRNKVWVEADGMEFIPCGAEHGGTGELLSIYRINGDAHETHLLVRPGQWVYVRIVQQRSKGTPEEASVDS